MKAYKTKHMLKRAKVYTKYAMDSTELDFIYRYDPIAVSPDWGNLILAGTLIGRFEWETNSDQYKAGGPGGKR